MFWAPFGSYEYNWNTSSIDGQRPAAAMGQIITPGNNTKGSYNILLSSSNVTRDIYGLNININSNFVAANARDALLDIGVDTAGGSNYVAYIPNLIASCASNLNLGGGLSYFFPIFIPSGSSVAARASVNNVTPGTLRCFVQAFGAPKSPQLSKAGSKVTAFGVTLTGSAGIAVPVGTTSDGPWVALATNISQSCWFWQVGMGCNDSTMTANGMYFVDLAYGDATNKHIIIKDLNINVPTANEALSTSGAEMGCYRNVPSGSNIYGRVQCSGTADSLISLIAYGVSG